MEFLLGFVVGAIAMWIVAMYVAYTSMNPHK